MQQNQQKNSVNTSTKERRKTPWSDVFWIISFLVVWFELDWATSMGFDNQDEALKSLGQVFIFGIIHLVSIPFVLSRGKKNDINNKESGVHLPIWYKNQFLLRLVFVILFIAILVGYVINGMGNAAQNKEIDVESGDIIEDVVYGTNNSNSPELVALNRAFIQRANEFNKNNFVNADKLLDSNFLEIESYESLENIIEIKETALLAANEYANSTSLRIQLFKEFQDEVEKSDLSVEDKEYMSKRLSQMAVDMNDEQAVVLAESYDYYLSIHYLYKFLEREWDIFFLSTDINGNRVIKFNETQATNEYNRYIEIINESYTRLEQATQKNDISIQQRLNDYEADVSIDDVNSLIADPKSF